MDVITLMKTVILIIALVLLIVGNVKNNINYIMYSVGLCIINLFIYMIQNVVGG